MNRKYFENFQHSRTGQGRDGWDYEEKHRGHKSGVHVDLRPEKRPIRDFFK